MPQCVPCGKKFTGFQNYGQHLVSEKHKKKMMSMGKSPIAFGSDYVTLSSSKNDKEIKCEVCGLSFDSFELFQIHASTAEHALKIMSKQKSNMRSSSSATNNHELNDIKCEVGSTNENIVLPELIAGESSDQWCKGCVVCSKKFSGPEPYKQHLESQAHKKKVAFHQNSEIKVENLGSLKCEPCDKSFSGIAPYEMHMKSEVHKKKLQNIQNANLWYCDICKKQCTGQTPYEQHIQGSTHFKNEKKLKALKKFAETDNVAATEMQEKSAEENLRENNLSEDSENASQLTNDSYQSSNGEKQKDFVSSEEMNTLEDQSRSEPEMAKVVLPNDKIDFNEVDVVKILGKIQNDSQKNKKAQDDENDFEPLKKKMKQETRPEVCHILQIGDELSFDNYANEIENPSCMD